MDFISYVNVLTPTVLQGKGKGVRIEPIDLEQFRKEINYKSFRGAYILGHKGKTCTHHVSFLKENVIDILMSDLHIFNERVFNWYDVHKVVYYVELIPDTSTSVSLYRITCNELLGKDDSGNDVYSPFVHPKDVKYKKS